VTRASADPGLVRRWALSIYRRLPRRARLGLLRALAPSHTVGSLVLLEHEGRLLMLRQRHRRGWTLPGGLVDRGENAEQAAVREVREETGLHVEVAQPVTVVVDPGSRRVDILFHVPVRTPPEVVPASEALEAAWLIPAEAGPLDEATATALNAFARALRDGARAGRVLAPAPPPHHRPDHADHADPT
jgi:ADP-ribose pyrophosphatase YjhB (NUDIX family)